MVASNRAERARTPVRPNWPRVERPEASLSEADRQFNKQTGHDGADLGWDDVKPVVLVAPLAETAKVFAGDEPSDSSAEDSQDHLVPDMPVDGDIRGNRIDDEGDQDRSEREHDEASRFHSAILSGVNFEKPNLARMLATSLVSAAMCQTSHRSHAIHDGIVTLRRTTD